jgi:8-oxo-dGTP diphosphatase
MPPGLEDSRLVGVDRSGIAGSAPLRVIAAAVLDPRRGLLLVSKRRAPDVFYLPGGKPEPAEEPLACLGRELHEELGVGFAHAERFAEVRAPAAFERRAMWMTVFIARLVGVPVPAAEIAAARWWKSDDDVALAPAVRDCVIPRLRTAGHL